LRLTIDLGVKKDLTSKEVVSFDSMLRKAIPELVGWAYSPLTGELTLDFGDAEDNNILAKIQDWLSKAGGKKVLSFELLGMVKE